MIPPGPVVPPPREEAPPRQWTRPTAAEGRGGPTTNGRWPAGQGSEGWEPDSERGH